VLLGKEKKRSTLGIRRSKERSYTTPKLDLESLAEASFSTPSMSRFFYKFLCFRQARLAGEGTVFWTCSFVCSSCCQTCDCEHDILKTCELILMSICTAQKHEMFNFGGQEVNVWGGDIIFGPLWSSRCSNYLLLLLTNIELSSSQNESSSESFGSS